MKPFKTCYLHIGSQKTGSTSIQNFLSDNREFLMENNLFYPTSFCHAYDKKKSQHTGLSIIAKNTGEKHFVFFRHGLSTEQDIEAYKVNAKNEFEDEIKKSDFDPGKTDIILSSETLFNRINSVEEIKRLKNLLDKYCESFVIIAYLRRQDKFLVSQISTLAKMGWEAPRLRRLLNENSDISHIDYFDVLEKYSSIFGHDNLKAQVFERSMLGGGDLISDFCDKINLPINHELIPEHQMNPSLNEFGLQFLIDLNKHILPTKDGQINPLRSGLPQILTMHYPGSNFHITKMQAENFLGRFAECNKQTKQKYFPNLDRDSLFENDLSMYPDERKSEDFTVEQYIEGAAILWLEQAKRIQNLQQITQKHRETIEKHRETIERQRKRIQQQKKVIKKLSPLIKLISIPKRLFREVSKRTFKR